MNTVESYRIAWNTEKDEGIFLLQTEDGVKQLLADSAAEGMLLLDMLRNEKPIYVKDSVLLTGFEPVGEGEESSTDEKKKKKKKKKS